MVFVVAYVKVMWQENPAEVQYNNVGINIPGDPAGIQNGHSQTRTDVNINLLGKAVILLMNPL
jgi:hypothetical protein